MTMHLVGPWLSTTGKKKGPRKFRNAESAQTARQNAEKWQQFRQEVGAPAPERRREFKPYQPPALNYRAMEWRDVQSVETTMQPCTRPEAKVYTGTTIIGISTLHKSNAIPVISKQEAIDISKMRR